jgi:hypothetical protein
MFKSVSFLLRVLYDVPLSYAFTLQTQLYRKFETNIPRNETAQPLVPNSYIHVSVSNLYIPTSGPPILPQF